MMKHILFLAALSGSLCWAVPGAHAQEPETEPAPTSKLAGVALPADALRITPNSVPKEISSALTQAVEQGGPKIKQGRSEVLAWTGGNYKISRVPQIKSQLQNTLTKAGWTYEENKADTGDTKDDVSVISVIRTVPTKKGIIGFWTPTDDALVLSWTEMLPNTTAAPNTTPDEKPNTPPVATPATTTPKTAAAGSPTGATVLEMTANQGTVNVMKGVMPKMPTFPALAPKAGFVRGYVKDVNGKPLKGAKIGVRSTAIGGAYSGAQAQSDEKGYYEIQVPFGVASYYCAGYTMDWGEGRGAFGLCPADGEAGGFASNKGAVENWVLLPYGIADRDDVTDQPQYSGNYYGGTINVGYWVSDGPFAPADNLPDGSQVEVTFTPTGPVLGGGKGQTFVVRHAVSVSARSNFYVNNLPIAPYRLSAVLIDGGQRTPLHLKETGPYSSSAFGLDPKEGDGSVNLMLRPESAKAEMATAAHGNWESLSVTLSRK